MSYLLFLQTLRELAPEFINESILFLSEVMGGTYGLITMAIIYWGFNKKIGRLSLLSFSTSYQFNQTLKNIFCIPRPFILNPELTPYKMASGYSFPSGHTMLGTSIYASIAIWFKKHKVIVCITAILSLMTAFGRNWIGVHTLQDVFVGMQGAIFVVFMNLKLLEIMENNPKTRYLYTFISFIWGIIVLFIFKGSEKVVGLYLGTIFGYLIESEWIQFEIQENRTKKIIRILLGILILLVLNKILLPHLVFTNPNVTTFITNFITFFYVVVIYPFIFKMIKL